MLPSLGPVPGVFILSSGVVMVVLFAELFMLFILFILLMPFMPLCGELAHWPLGAVLGGAPG